MITCLRVAGTLAVALASSADAEAVRSNVAFNTSIQQVTGEQPTDGVALSYPVTLSGGELDGCEAQIAETLYPRDEGNWGIFRVHGDVTCDGGTFRFTSSGAWDRNGFHGAGEVLQESGVGKFAGLSGRVAQIGGSLVPATMEGTFDVTYQLLLDRIGD